VVKPGTPAARRQRGLHIAPLRKQRRGQWKAEDKDEQDGEGTPHAASVTVFRTFATEKLSHHLVSA
jgi:hypothetical protein